MNPEVCVPLLYSLGEEAGGGRGEVREGAGEGAGRGHNAFGLEHMVGIFTGPESDHWLPPSFVGSLVFYFGF